MQKSMIARQLIWDGTVSLAVLDTTALVAEAISRHGLSALAAAALGRTLTATAYLCSWLKEEGSVISVTVDGHGAGGKIRTAGDGALNLRGFVDHPDVVLPPRADGKLDVGGFTGRDGTITVVRDDGEGIPFVGTSPLRSGELGDDFSAYFLISEQRPTAIALGVRIATDGSCLGAGGVFLQPMPGADEEAFARTEAAIGRYREISRRRGGRRGDLFGLRPSLPRRDRAGNKIPLPLFEGTCGRGRLCDGQSGGFGAPQRGGGHPRPLSRLQHDLRIHTERGRTSLRRRRAWRKVEN